MKSTEFALALSLSALLAACDAGAPAAPAREAATPPAEPTAATAPPASTQADPQTAPASGNEDDADAAAAETVVRDYYRAIDARDFTTAYALWSNDGAASGQDFAHFSDGYADTSSVTAQVGIAFGLEGAAGSRYIQVPVQVAARQRDGSMRRYEGRFTLRAVMADGANESQRHWHLYSAEMTRLPDPPASTQSSKR